MFRQIYLIIQEESRHPGTVDKILLVQQIQHLLQETPSVGTLMLTQETAAILRWYTGTIDRWRRSLRSHRPLADVHPVDRPRVRALLNNK